MRGFQKPMLVLVLVVGSTLCPRDAGAVGLLAAVDQVSITSPASGTATNQSKVDVTVSFSTDLSGQGGGNVTTVQLLVNGVIVAAFDNPPEIKSGTHLFPSVDLSSFANTGAGASLVARAFHGNVNAGHFVDSVPVTFIVDTIPPA